MITIDQVVAEIAAMNDDGRLWSEGIWCVFCKIDRYPNWVNDWPTRKATVEDHKLDCLYRRVCDGAD